MSQEHRIALLALPGPIANSGVIIRGCENGDAAGRCFAAKCLAPRIDWNVHLVFDRVSRNRMGARFRRRAGVLDIGISTLVHDAEYRTRRGQSEIVVTAGK